MNQAFSRDTFLLQIPAGKTADFSTVSDYFHVFSIQDAGGNEQTINVSVNKANAFAPIKSGQGGQGRVGAGDIQTLKFQNPTGASVTVTLIFGNGAANFAGMVNLAGGQVSLTAATIASLINAQTLTPVCEGIGAGLNKTYSGFKSIEIIATGTGFTTITSPGGLNFAIPGGESKEFSCENDSDVIADITVTNDANNTAEVTGLKVP